MKQFLLFIWFICGVSFSDAQDSTVYYKHGMFLDYRFDAPKDFLDSVNKLIMNYPDSAQFYYTRGRIHLSNKTPSLAKEDFKRSVEIDSAFLPALYYLSRMAYLEANYTKTIFYGKEYLKYGEQDYNVIFTLARSLSKKRMYEDAVYYYQKLPIDTINSYELTYDIAKCYSQIRDTKNSKDYYIKALEKIDKDILTDSLKYRKPNFRSYFLRAHINRLLNNYRNVLEDYDKSISIEPDKSYLYFNRGIARKELGRKAESCSDFYMSAKMGYGKSAVFELCQNCFDLCEQYCKETGIENPNSKKKKRE